MKKDKKIKESGSSAAETAKKSEKKSKNKSQKRRTWFNVLLRRRVEVAILLVVQIALIAWLLISGSRSSVYVNAVLNILSWVVVCMLTARQGKGSFKLTWVILILAFPLFGGLFYLLSNFQSSTFAYRKKLKKIDNTLMHPAFEGCGCYEEASAALTSHLTQIRYLEKFAGFPIWNNTSTDFLTPGEKYLERLLVELEKAEKYIFLEYFIVEEGKMWDSIFEVLKRKVAAGVEVRLMYDDVGCFFLLPTNYRTQLEAAGIKCRVFNPFVPFLTVLQNNRDHRKICVIDGKVAFTGGINLADEYINARQRFGHWKDSGIVLEGDAAWSFTVMFLQMWKLASSGKKTETEDDWHDYLPARDPFAAVQRNGYVQPYADSPMDFDNVGEHVYLQMISNAKKYLYINTPYLIIDDSMVSALTLAAKSGVDVRIITPHRWDKRFVHITTRSYYRDLIRAGVRIYEYSNGFLHSKTFVSDDDAATVGTTNLDFRSLYLHFECGVWMCGTSAVAQVKEDFLRTMELSEEITLETCRGTLLERIVQPVLRLFAPLM